MILNSLEKSEFAVLKDRTGHPVPLTGIDVTGSISDVFSRVTITQTYENREEKNIEAVYSFPLPLDAILLDFTVTIDGRVRHGTVMKKAQAREKYEDAVEQGNSAAMLEKIDEGLYSMSVGNILSGQKIEISFSYSQFNIWNGHQLRFYLPSVVAPKYGDPAKAGIDSYQAPVTSLTAQNALKCSISVVGNLSKCSIASPTHEVKRSEIEGGIQLAVSAFADRDFILDIRSDSNPVPYAVTGRDGDGYVSAVAMTPDFGEMAETQPRYLDIIIDCSGSMSGQSIEQARVALKKILDRLTSHDSFNIIRFGSTVVPLFSEHMPYSEESIARARILSDNLKADLGGTEIVKALATAYKTTVSDRLHDILLVTDGQVYVDDQFYSDAVNSHCRIFSVGVGSAVSEGILRKLSQVTRGMPEFVTPNEDMAERIVRHFQRMSLPVMESEISWPVKPDWVWPEKNPQLFHGDTTVFFACFSEKPEGTVELRTASSENNYSWNLQLPQQADETECSDLARMAVRRRITGRTDEKAADLAEKYRLVTSLTNYLLVEENEDADKLSLPEMRTVPQMAPAGFLGAATCCASSVLPGFFSSAVFAGGMMGMKGSSKMCSRSAPEPQECSEVKNSGSVSGTKVYYDGLVLSLSGLETADVKKLFSEKSIAALENLGLPKVASARLNEIVAGGVSERVVFILFLNRLLSVKSSLAGTSVAEYITRGYSRLAASELNIPALLQPMFDELFAGS